MRWALFLGLWLTLGGLAGARLARRTRGKISSSEPEAEPSPWVRPGLWLGLVAAVGLALLYLGDGSIGASLDRFSIEPFLNAGPGRLAALEVLALTGALILTAVRQPAWSGLLAAAVAVLEGFGPIRSLRNRAGVRH